MSDSSFPASIPRPPIKTGLEWWHYILGVSSLVPLLGLLTGLISLILGIVKFKQGGWILVLLAFLGFGSTFGLGYYLYYEIFLNRTGVIGMARKKVTQDNLTRVAREIESYKMVHGQYPKALTDLPSDVQSHIYDTVIAHGNTRDLKFFMYDVMPDGQTYYVFSRGPDGEAFTADDLFPQLDADEASRFGYRQRPGDLASLQSSPVPASHP